MTVDECRRQPGAALTLTPDPTDPAVDQDGAERAGDLAVTAPDHQPRLVAGILQIPHGLEQRPKAQASKPITRLSLKYNACVRAFMSRQIFDHAGT